MAKQLNKKLDEIKEYILGKKYDLSLVFAKDSLIKKLNSIYRKKKSSTNVLAFPLSESEGEVFINQKNKDKAVFLFIHAILHLKGYKHGKKMEKKEDSITKIFGYGSKYNNRN